VVPGNEDCPAPVLEPPRALRPVVQATQPSFPSRATCCAFPPPGNAPQETARPPPSPKTPYVPRVRLVRIRRRRRHDEFERGFVSIIEGREQSINRWHERGCPSLARSIRAYYLCSLPGPRRARHRFPAPGVHAYARGSLLGVRCAGHRFPARGASQGT